VIYNIGTSVPLTWQAGTSLGSATLQITDPSGNVSTQTVSDSGSGTYNATYVPGVYGRFQVLWTAVQGGTDGSYQDVFDVRPNGMSALVSLSDVTEYLNLPTQPAVELNKLQRILNASSILIQDITGPMAPTVYTEWFDGGTETVSPSHKPVIRVLSAAEYYGISEFVLTEQPLGFQTDAFAFTVDYITGEVMRRTYGGAAAQYAIGDKNVRITYQAGRSYVPENVQLGTLELVRFFYNHTQVPSGRGGRPAGPDGLENVLIGFAVPNFVVEMVQPHWRGPGIA
jgi:hypothetical protein